MRLAWTYLKRYDDSETVQTSWYIAKKWNTINTTNDTQPNVYITCFVAMVNVAEKNKRKTLKSILSHNFVNTVISPESMKEP